jgi:hypothetical protein
VPAAVDVQDQAELDRYRNTWPLRNYIIALYRRQASGTFDVHTIRDAADVPRYESLAVGVYSDEPFAVSSQRSAAEQPPPVDPVFPPGIVPA